MKYLKPFQSGIFVNWLLLSISLFLFFAPVSLSAQEKVVTEQVKQLFKKPKRVKWIRHYTGKIDQMNDVSMTIAFDGRRCRGLFIYTDSQDKFQLEGDIIDGQLSLKEKDKNDKTSGYLRGQLSATSFSGTWKNKDQDLSRILQLQIAETPLERPLPCATDHWVRSYQFDAYQLLVQHLGNQQYNGYVNLPGYPSTYQFRNNGEQPTGEPVFELLDLYGKSVGYLRSETREKDKWTFTFIDRQGITQVLEYTLQEQLAVSCSEQANYLSHYDITYPQSTYTAFNQYLKEIAEEWMQSCKEYTSVVAANERNYRPELRSSYSAYAWTDICFYDWQLISGQFLSQKSWQANTKGQSFIYDLGAERALSEKDIFNPAFPRRAFLWEKLKSELPNYPMYADKDFREWMQNNDFPHLLLSPEGLCFCTEFNMIYGQQKLIIPYQEILPYLKKDCAVAAIARKL